MKFRFWIAAKLMLLSAFSLSLQGEGEINLENYLFTSSVYKTQTYDEMIEDMITTYGDDGDSLLSSEFMGNVVAKAEEAITKLQVDDHDIRDGKLLTLQPPDHLFLEYGVRTEVLNQPLLVGKEKELHYSVLVNTPHGRHLLLVSLLEQLNKSYWSQRCGGKLKIFLPEVLRHPLQPPPPRGACMLDNILENGRVIDRDMVKQKFDKIVPVNEDFEVFSWFNLVHKNVIERLAKWIIDIKSFGSAYSLLVLTKEWLSKRMFVELVNLVIIGRRDTGFSLPSMETYMPGDFFDADVIPTSGDVDDQAQDSQFRVSLPPNHYGADHVDGLNYDNYGPDGSSGYNSHDFQHYDSDAYVGDDFGDENSYNSDRNARLWMWEGFNRKVTTGLPFTIMLTPLERTLGITQLSTALTDTPRRIMTPSLSTATATTMSIPISASTSIRNTASVSTIRITDTTLRSSRTPILSTTTRRMISLSLNNGMTSTIDRISLLTTTMSTTLSTARSRTNRPTSAIIVTLPSTTTPRATTSITTSRSTPSTTRRVPHSVNTSTTRSSTANNNSFRTNSESGPSWPGVLDFNMRRTSSRSRLTTMGTKATELSSSPIRVLTSTRRALSFSRTESSTNNRISTRRSRPWGADGMTWTRTRPEEAEWYFREDPVANAHHVEWHRLNSGPRRGEYFYFMHGQMLARYQAERLSLGLGLAEMFLPEQWNRMIEDEYDPRLGSRWGVRKRGTINAVRMRNMKDTIEMLAEFTPRYFRGVDTGIDRFGGVFERGLHNTGHMEISQLSGTRGVMGSSVGAMRDPIFYRWHSYVESLFKRYKNKLAEEEPYSDEELSFPGVKVVSASVQPARGEVDTFYTYREMASVRLDNIDATSPGSRMSIEYMRMNHRQFQWDLVINSELSERVPAIVRIFMMPSQGGVENNATIHMDHFYVDLNPGDNVIEREELEAPHLSKSRWSLNQLQENLLSGQMNRADFTWGGCGWPRHLNIPRGTEEGMSWTLVFMVSKVLDQDLSNLETWKMNNNLAWSYCGVRSGNVPDSRPMGFPVDRDFSDINKLANGRENWHIKQVIIKHGRQS